MIDGRIEERLGHDYAYHEINVRQDELINRIREAAHDFAILIADVTPTGREQSIALTHIEEAFMMAREAITRHE